MTAPVHQRGAPTSFVPELLVRQVLIEGLHDLGGDRFRLEELFRRVDDLTGGSQVEWLEEFRERFGEILRSEWGLPVNIGYPDQASHLPCVSVVLSRSDENEGEARCGDLVDVRYEQIGTPEEDDPTTSRTYRHDILGGGWIGTVQVGTWTVAPEESLLISQAVYSALLEGKGRLLAAGVHDLSFSEAGFEPSPDLAARTAYVPTLQCTMRWTRLQTRRTGPVPTRATFLTPTWS